MNCNNTENAMVHGDDDDDDENDGSFQQQSKRNKDNIPSNERLLGIAFITFMSFAATQLVFAFIADSQAMMGDSAAMVVDSITYLFNYIAERKKRHYDASSTHESSCNALLHSSENNPSMIDDTYNYEDPVKVQRIRKRNRRKMVLQLEIIPPIISVSTLIVVTIFITHKAIKMLSLDTHRSKSEQKLPNLQLMLTFSLINLGLDGLNVFCFARAKHLMGYSTTPTTKNHDTITSTTTRNDDNNINDDDESIASETVLLSDTINKLNNYMMDDIRNVDSNMTTLSHSSTIQNYNRTLNEYTTAPSSRSNDPENTNSENRCVVNNNELEENHTIEGCHSQNCTEFDLDRFPIEAATSSGHNNCHHVYRKLGKGNYKKGDDDVHDDEEEEDEQTNLNMCSAYTHVFADTLRSIAVIIAAVMAEVVPNITPEVADSTAAVIVSILILLSLIPLLQGLIASSNELRTIYEEERSDMALLQPPTTATAHLEMT
jgi:Co/Zn/Cd efflux system component